MSPGRLHRRLTQAARGTPLHPPPGAALRRYDGEATRPHDGEETYEVVPETAQRTRVELEHRNIDRHGPGREAVRDGVDTDQGWPLSLHRYAALLVEGG